jgi:signal peptidase I
MKKSSSFIRESITFILLAVFVVLPVRAYVAQPFIVNGASMDPTLHTGQYLIIDEISYRFSPPARGDVVVFRYPDAERKFFIKRIIGLPGETVELAGTEIIIHNDAEPDGFPLTEHYRPSAFNHGASTKTLGENEYFMMGDNRGASFDSRAWGPLEKEFIVGRALVSLFPVSSLDIFPGKARFDK